MTFKSKNFMQKGFESFLKYSKLLNNKLNSIKVFNHHIFKYKIMLKFLWELLYLY